MSDYSFKKKYRLLKNSDYLDLRKNSKKIQNLNFYLIYKNNNNEFSRIGLTVSRRTGNAVVRNRIKRIIRDYYRKNRYLIQNFDINIIAKKAVAGKTNKEILESINSLFIKIGIERNG